MSETNSKQKAALSADVMDFGVNVTVEGAKKYYIQALACLSLSVSKKLEKPLPQLLGEVAAYFWGSHAVEPVPHREDEMEVANE